MVGSDGERSYAFFRLEMVELGFVMVGLHITPSEDGDHWCRFRVVDGGYKRRHRLPLRSGPP
jgi:hypothetical protein